MLSVGAVTETQGERKRQMKAKRMGTIDLDPEPTEHVPATCATSPTTIST